MMPIKGPMKSKNALSLEDENEMESEIIIHSGWFVILLVSLELQQSVYVILLFYHGTMKVDSQMK